MKRILNAQTSPIDDRDYVANDIVEAINLPTSYEAQPTKILNQGSVGSCVAHAISSAMMSQEKNTIGNNNYYSVGFIYANRAEDDYQGKGIILREALKQLHKCGDVLHEDFPYNIEYPKIKSKLTDDLYDKALPYKIQNYFRCNTIDEIKRTIMTRGGVIVLSPVYGDLKKYTDAPKENDKKIGSHVMLIVGWTEDDYWIVQNSWGKYWQGNGKFFMSFDYPNYEYWGITISKNEIKTKKKWYVQIWEFIVKLFS